MRLGLLTKTVGSMVFLAALHVRAADAGSHGKAAPELAPAPRRVYPHCRYDKDEPGNVDLTWTLSPVGRTILGERATTQAELRERLEAIDVASILRDDAVAQAQRVATHRKQFLESSQQQLDEAAQKAQAIALRSDALEIKLDLETPKASEAVNAATDRLSKVAAEMGRAERITTLGKELSQIPALRSLQAEAKIRSKELGDEAWRLGKVQSEIRTALAKEQNRSFNDNALDTQLEDHFEYQQLEEQIRGLRTQKQEADARMGVFTTDDLSKLAARIDRGRSRNASEFDREIYSFFAKRPADAKLVQDVAELWQIATILQNHELDFYVAGQQVRESESMARARSKERIPNAALFARGQTVDFTLAVEMQKLPGAGYYVRSVSPMVGRAKMQGAGVRFSFFESDPEEDPKATKRRAVDAAKQWLEKPQLTATPSLHCRP